MALMGTARASGENRAAEAAQRAISSPLLEDTSIKGARGLLINVTGGQDMSLYEVNEAASLIQEEAHEEANIIFGAVIDEAVGDEIQVTVIATGFGERGRERDRHSGRHPHQATPIAAPLPDVSEPPIELESAPNPTVSRQAPVQPPQRDSSNANHRPVRRLGLIDDTSLDAPAFMPGNGKPAAATNHSGRSGFERD
jgi:cell division GTPase FtsZ